jgi:hypothetical protein
MTLEELQQQLESLQGEIKRLTQENELLQERSASAAAGTPLAAAVVQEVYERRREVKVPRERRNEEGVYPKKCGIRIVKRFDELVGEVVEDEVPKFEYCRMVDFYRYRIELPPSGGLDVRINGVPYYHGQEYSVDLDTLRTLKDAVHRSWAHEASIRGSNENAYRRPNNFTLHGNSARA